MPASVAILAGLTAAGIGFGVGAATSGGKKQSTPAPAPEIPTLAPAPTPVDAKEAAREAEVKRRRMQALSGGKTLLTSESPTLSGGSGKTLLGG